MLRNILRSLHCWSEHSVNTHEGYHTHVVNIKKINRTQLVTPAKEKPLRKADKNYPARITKESARKVIEKDIEYFREYIYNQRWTVLPEFTSRNAKCGDI